jgi:DNA (cytosine-5)-methyltransferase 1
VCAGFPCFIEGTKVLTNSGYKNIEDVLLEDKLLTHMGIFQNILNLQRKICCGDIYNIKIKYHSEQISCTEEHPFYVREKTRKWNSQTKKYDSHYKEPEWKPANKLGDSDYYGMVINTTSIIPEFTFEKKVVLYDKKQWYMLGYYAKNRQDNQINSPNILQNILKEFVNNDNDWTIPEWVHNAPIEFIQEFIKGCMKACESQIISVSYNFAYGLQRLYLKLGYIYSVKKQEDMYILIEKKDSNAFIENNYAWFPVSDIQITKTTNTPVYNFEVENDNSYIVENIIVHNCQPFSNGGKKKTFEDERGLLFDEIMRIAREKKPRFLFLENVKHILKVSNGEVIEYIKAKICNLGYKLQIFEISPHNYGIPQQRERVYFVCVRNDIYNGKDIVLPTFSGQIEMSNYLDEKETIDKKYFINGEILKVLEAWEEMVQKFQVGEKISPTIMMNDALKTYSDEEFALFPDWKRDYITKNKPLIEKYRPEFEEWYPKYSQLLQRREIYGKLEWQTGVIRENESIFNHFIQIRQSGIRVKKSKYFPTLVAISQIPIYGKEKRYITPRECARLQSFPDSFILSKEDKHSYKQLGNSVNVDNVYTVISSTLKHYGLA